MKYFKLVKTAHYFLEPLTKTDIFCSALLPSFAESSELLSAGFCFSLSDQQESLSFSQLQNLCSYILCICEHTLSCWTSSDTHQIEIIQPNSTLPGTWVSFNLFCACQSRFDWTCMSDLLCLHYSPQLAPSLWLDTRPEQWIAGYWVCQLLLSWCFWSQKQQVGSE